MENTEKEILDMFSEKPKEFKISLEKRNFWQRIRKIKEKKYKIKPLVLRKYLKIATLFNECKELLIVDNKTNDILANSIDGIAKYNSQIVKIISLFINESEDFVLDNLDINETQAFFLTLLKHLQFIQFSSILKSAATQMSLKIPKSEKEN